MAMRSYTVLVACALLLCSQASAQSDGALWSDTSTNGGSTTTNNGNYANTNGNYATNGSNNNYQVGTAYANSRADTSPQVAKKILLDLYAATSGYDWKDATGWNNVNADDVCGWKGVDCYDASSYQAGEIRQLDLSHNNLHGSLPASVFSLPYLESLDVSGNPDLSVDLASGGLRQANHLRFLVLSQTKVVNLQSIGEAAALEELYTADSGVSGPVPPALLNSPTLKVWHANDNALSGPLPATYNTNRLEELVLGNNRLTGQLPSEVGNLSLLQILALTNNPLGGTLPSALEALTNLRTLSIQRTPSAGGVQGSGISGPVPSLAGHRRLTKVQLEFQNLSGSLPPDFLRASPAGDAIEVDLRGNRLTGGVPAVLADKRFLSLYLAGNRIASVPAQLYDATFQTCPSLADWMGGDVAAAGCQAFLCPPGTWAPQGRATRAESCQRCLDAAGVWGSIACQSSQTAGETERQILVNVYNALNGRNWKNDQNWLDLNADVCSWYGIGCDGSTGRVTTVDLANNGLSGVVPADLFDLPELQTVVLKSNPIEIDFAIVAKAQSLVELDLEATGLRFLNNLSRLSGLPNFRRLVLASNGLTGPIPEAIFSIPSLETLLLSHNGFTGTLSPSLSNLVNLKVFDAGGNDHTGPLPAGLGRMTNLEVFLAHDNQFTGTLPQEFNGLTNLKILSLFQQPSDPNNRAGGLVGPLPSFANLSKLSHLLLDNNKLTGTLPSDFLINSRPDYDAIDGYMVEVTLSNNRLVGTIPESWARFDDFYLDLAGNQITGIPSALCSKTQWNMQDVGRYGCNAILCPVGTYQPESGKGSNCLACPSSSVMGATSCGSQNAGGGDASSELSILTELFSATGGNDWTNRDGWFASTGDYCTSFYGVECDGAGRVTTIDLSNNNLQGTLPSSIFRLESLRTLKLSGNPIFTTFEGIGGAPKLVELDIENTNTNSLAGIGEATNLQVLNAADNDLKGTIPSDIYQITSLKTLNLGHNSFSGQLEDNFRNLRNSLESLVLYHNQFTGRIPASIGDFFNLRILNLAENNFEGTIPAEINGLSSLQFLSLQREGGIDGFFDVGINHGKSSQQGLGLTGPLPSFDGLAQLTELYLGVNGLTGTIPYNFLGGVGNKATEIKVDLTSNSLEGTIPASLTQFDNMSLYAAGNRFTAIADGICGKPSWMGGDVGRYGCDGILCPSGSYSGIGRASSGAALAAPSCQPCNTGTSGYLGSFECLSASDAQEGSERDILEKLYYDMDGPNWIDNTNWLDPDESICNWFGIQCDSLSTRSVTSIDLSYNGLKNEFPKRTYKLPNLKELNLQGNVITFSFNGIRNAANLESLDLEDTGLTSLFGIGQASNLKLLRVNNNKFSSFPNEVFDLQNLEVLSLSDNLFSGEAIPSNLQFFGSMTYFACSACGFRGQIPAWLGSMQNLQYLKLSQNALTGILPPVLETITTLKHLDLSDQATMGRGLDGNLLSFSTQTDLTELYLQHNSFSGGIPENFMSSVRKDKLVTIDLRYNRLGGVIPVQLGNINQLNVYLAANLFESIPDTLCGKDWNDGDVAKNGCDGLLCPAATFNSFGRATEGVDCFACDNPMNGVYVGNTWCGMALEHEALKSLYRTYGGQSWTSANNWMESEDHCTWEGITCWTGGEYDGLVKSIDLSDNNLVGDAFFTLIWQLEGLTSVDLSKNDISFPNFAFVANAINLETINLSYTRQNSLQDLGGAKSLKALHLTGSSFVGPIPEELFTLPLLESLFLSHNGFSGTISPEIGQLKQLKNLYLLDNKLTGTIPPELGYIARLEHLSLGRNQLQGSIPRQITSLPLLEFLSLENEAHTSNGSFAMGVGLSGPLPALDGLPRIRELYLQHNSFTGTIPDHFLKGINDKSAKTSIDLSFNYLDGSIPAELSTFDDLVLKLVGNEISGIPTEICNSKGWMNGEVANSCDAILCPPGKYNNDGYQVDSTTPCKTCTYAGAARNYGSTTCAPGSADALDIGSILFDLYDATGGDSWTTSTGWKSNNVPYCNWYGVTCATTDSGDSVISELNLAKNNLKGIVPSKVFFLQGLKKLDVRQNPVAITFQDINKAFDLKELYIDETLVKSLDGIGGAPSLEILHAYKNSFGRQQIPDEVFDISTLTDINLSDSMLVGTLSGKIGKLTNLQRVTLDGNSLSGELPSQLGQLTALKAIEISNNKWIGMIPSSWGALGSLEALFINNDDEKTAGVTGPLPSFANTRNLKNLSLSNNQLTGAIPSNFLSGIADVNSLVTVRLDKNHISGTIPSSLQIFSKLNIDVTGNYIAAIGDGLCNQAEWNDGNVGSFGCDGILCPVGTFSPSGRQTSSADNCKACPDENSYYLGDTSCVTFVKQQEKEILGKLFQATNGKNWKSQDGWTVANSDVCSWHGIGCGDDSTVESVHLGSNNLVGSVPKEIFDLPNLKSLWLYSNPVKFSFDGIGKATKLKSLRLDSTKLQSLNGIESGLSLVEVDVGFNQLSGPIPNGINNLVDLEIFSGPVNSFTGPVPDFSNLRKLSTVRLNDNKLSGALPSFSRHSNIKSIDLSDNDLSGPIPSNFLETVNQEENLFVDLSNNQLTGNVPRSLSRVNDLTIYLRDNRIGGIDSSLCSKDGWNKGDVESFRCDGILCPAGTYAVHGRASRNGSSCEACNRNKYYGSSTCGRSAGTSRSPAMLTTLVVAVTTSVVTLFF